MGIFDKFLKKKAKNTYSIDELKEKKDVAGLINALESPTGIINFEDIKMIMEIITEIASESAYKEFSKNLINSYTQRIDVIKILKTDSRAYDWLVNSILNFSDSSCRKICAKLLVEVDESKTLTKLEQAVNNEDERIACFAVESLGDIFSKNCIDVLFQALNSGREWLSPLAGKVLSEFDITKDIFNELVTLCNNENRYIRRGAIVAIARINNSKAAEVLANYINDSDKEVHKVARKGLIDMGKLGIKALENKLGYDEALRILDPDKYKKNVKAHRERQGKEKEKFLLDINEIARVLKSLKVTQITGPDKNIDEASIKDHLTTARTIQRFWRKRRFREYSLSWDIDRIGDYTDIIIKNRKVIVRTDKLILTLKASLKSGLPYKDKFVLTVIRLGEDEYLASKGEI